MRGRRRRGEARALREHMGQAVGCLGRYAGRAVPGMGGVGAGRYAGRAVRGTGGRYAPGLLGPSILLLGRYGAAYRPRGTTRTTTTRTRKVLAIWLPEAVPPPPPHSDLWDGRRPSKIFAKYFWASRPQAERNFHGTGRYGADGRRPSKIFTKYFWASRPQAERNFHVTGRYGAVRDGTGRYGAVRGGTGRYGAVRVWACSAL